MYWEFIKSPKLGKMCFVEYLNICSSSESGYPYSGGENSVLLGQIKKSEQNTAWHWMTQLCHSVLWRKDDTQLT